MAYGKITKVKNDKEKSNFQWKYFSLLLWVTQQLFYKSKNEIHRLLLFSRVAGPAVRRDHRCYTYIEDLHMTNPYNLSLRLMHAI